MSSAPVRVRFAPSPTGMFHVGSARSALYNWVMAKQSNGVMFLRIEDTDTARNKPEWVDGIISALSWLGITPDQYDGPHFQTGANALHAAAVERLSTSEHAYYCDCTREMVIARTNDVHRGYDGFCRDRGLTSGPDAALRFRVPDAGETVVDDQVRGRVAFSNSSIEDFIIARSDGSATFLLANVVDDMSMEITDVVRAEEHLPNTPKQQMLWTALGAIPPRWAHVSILVDEQRKKLSKRKHKVALEDYRAEGVLSETMRNYLMLLGWSPGQDREIVPWRTVLEEFRITDVNASAAFFDIKKLHAFNGEYIRALSVEEFIAACQPWLDPEGAPWAHEAYDPAVFARLAPLAQSRVAVLSEITHMVDFAFLAMPTYDEKSWRKAIETELAPHVLRAAYEVFADVSWDAETLKETLTAIGEEQGVKLGKAQAPVRVAVTGKTVGLPLFESLEVLGRERTRERIRHVLGKIE